MGTTNPTTENGIGCEKNPSIRILSIDRIYVRLRLEGGAVDPRWLRGKPPWCKVTIARDPGHEWAVLSFGGEVWPAAWPHLFRVGARTVNGQATTVTDEGRALIQAALDERGL